MLSTTLGVDFRQRLQSVVLPDPDAPRSVIHFIDGILQGQVENTTERKWLVACESQVHHDRVNVRHSFKHLYLFRFIRIVCSPNEEFGRLTKALRVCF